MYVSSIPGGSTDSALDSADVAAYKADNSEAVEGGGLSRKLL